MDTLALLAEAEAAGLRLSCSPDGDLLVRGPRTAQSIVARLQAAKREVVTALTSATASPSQPPQESFGWLGDWALLLDVDDLPEHLRFSPGEVVVDRCKYLAWLHADIRRGLDGPRARTGALQQDLQALWSALLSQAEAAS